MSDEELVEEQVGEVYDPLSYYLVESEDQVYDPLSDCPVESEEYGAGPGYVNQD